MKDTADLSQGKYMSTVRVGPRGQIVIPKEARQLFGLRPGDSILLLADAEQGIALQPMESCREMFARMFSPKPPL